MVTFCNSLSLERGCAPMRLGLNVSCDCCAGRLGSRHPFAGDAQGLGPLCRRLTDSGTIQGSSLQSFFGSDVPADRTKDGGLARLVFGEPLTAVVLRCIKISTRNWSAGGRWVVCPSVKADEAAFLGNVGCLLPHAA